MSELASLSSRWACPVRAARSSMSCASSALRWPSGRSPCSPSACRPGGGDGLTAAAVAGAPVWRPRRSCLRVRLTGAAFEVGRRRLLGGRFGRTGGRRGRGFRGRTAVLEAVVFLAVAHRQGNLRAFRRADGSGRAYVMTGDQRLSSRPRSTVRRPPSWPLPRRRRPGGCAWCATSDSPTRMSTAAGGCRTRAGQERENGLVGPAFHRRRADAQLQRVAVAPDDGRSTGTGLDPDIEDHSTVHALRLNARTTATCTG